LIEASDKFKIYNNFLLLTLKQRQMKLPQVAKAPPEALQHFKDALTLDASEVLKLHDEVAPEAPP
jgi:hypothetical protein